MYKLTRFRQTKNRITLMIISVLILFLLLISPAAASVNNWEFSPQEPVCGDTISITGNASPEEKVDVLVTFEKTVPVSSGKFEYILEDVKIPEGLNNFFKVEASGVKKLNVRVKVIAWITKSSEASGDTATVSQSYVPPGTYTIKIDGDAGEGVSDVNLKITAFQGIESDSNGDFSYSYNTKAVPAGDFEISVGDIMKKLTIQSGSGSDLSSDASSDSNSDSSSSNSSSSSSSSSLSSSSSSKNTKFSSSVGNNSSLLSETNSSPESVASNISEKSNSSEIKTFNKNLKLEETNVQPSEENIQKQGFFGSSIDKFYLLAGMGAGLLILIVYLRKK